MKKVLIFLFIAFISFPVFSQSLNIADDELIIFMKEGYTQNQLDSLLDNLEMEVIEGPTPNLGAMLIRYIEPPVIAAGGNPLGPITGGKEIAKNNPNVDGSGFNYGIASTNNHLQQHLSMIEDNCYDILDYGNPNGGNEVVTAIFDTGISWHATTQAAPYFDPTDMGYNAIRPNAIPRDRNGHGTHMASIIMNNLDNDNSAIQLKAYQTHRRNGKGELFDVIKALDYAITDGIDIINMSFVYFASSSHRNEHKVPLNIALDRTSALSDILIVAAAGNEDVNNDTGSNLIGESSYPSSLNFPKIISVASSSCQLEKSIFTSYGQTTVDVFAPGEDIWGKNHQWQDIQQSGSSQATAFVTKLATFLASHQETFDPLAIKCAILNSTTLMQQNSQGLTLTDGYINAYGALRYLLKNGNNCQGNYYEEVTEPTEIALSQSVKYLSERDMPSFEINSTSEAKALVSITNINGQVLVNDEIQLEKGINYYQKNFPKTGGLGLYLFTVQTKNGRIITKFIR